MFYLKIKCKETKNCAKMIIALLYDLNIFKGVKKLNTNITIDL